MFSSNGCRKRQGHVTPRLAARALPLLLVIGMLAACGGQGQSPAPADTPPATIQKPAAAEEPCASATTQAEMTRCWGEAAAAAEERSAAAYQKLSAWLRERQQDNVTTMFRETQARWEAYRDMQCASVAAVFEGGSIADLQTAQCRLRLAEGRTRDLETVMIDASN